MGILDIFKPKPEPKQLEAPKKRRRSIAFGRRMNGGRRPDPLRSPATGVVISDPRSNVDIFENHPGVGAGPDRVLSAFRSAERGNPAQQCDLFNDFVENDGHLRSLVTQQISSVTGTGWQVIPGGDDRSDVLAASLLDDALRKTNFIQLAKHQLTARYFGYAGSELTWGLDEGGRIVPRWFSNVMHRRFEFDDLGRPMLVLGNNAERVSLQRGRWMFSCNTSSGIIPRSGLLRTASWFALFKRMCVRDWVIFCEKFGVPLIWGKYDEEADESDIDELHKAVTDVGEAGQGIFPREFEIVIEHAVKEGSADSAFGALTLLCNSEMSKLIVGATLTNDTGGPGSFALGQVHDQARFALTLSAAQDFAEQFVQDVSGPFVEYNGLPARAPRVRFHIVRDQDPEKRAKVLDLLANNLGLELDEAQVRQEFQVKPPAGDPLTGSAQQPVPAETPEIPE